MPFSIIAAACWSEMPFGQHHQPFGRNDARLGIGAERPAGIGDAVAGLHLADARADLLDDTRAPRRLGRSAAAAG